MGGFLVLCSWGLLVGWGTAEVRTFAGSEENPTFVLAKRLWGHAWIVVLLALLNSMIAVAIASNNGATRVWFAMARSGSLPRALAKVHPRFRTPVNAVVLQAIVTLAVGLGLGVWIGPDKEFELMGAVVTFALIYIYSAGNLGVFLLYFQERRTEFHWILHVVFPLLGTLALLFVGYKSLVPWPTAPVAYAPWMVGIWFVLGLVILVVMRLTGREQWMLKAGTVTQERSDSQH
jgi:amino acid transporter